ncbi:MAG: translation initiation factor IF-2 [Deltaproteobacteria bacterium]|nr:translation initiation factor IF-2 [Deltaproteobacteria bacterium]
MRVYEMAKEVGLANKELVAKIRTLGIEIKNHMSALEPEDVMRIRRALDKERQENTVTERIQPTVIRRRNKMTGNPAGDTVPAPSRERQAFTTDSAQKALDVATHDAEVREAASRPAATVPSKLPTTAPGPRESARESSVASESQLRDEDSRAPSTAVQGEVKPVVLPEAIQEAPRVRHEDPERIPVSLESREAPESTPVIHEVPRLEQVVAKASETKIEPTRGPEQVEPRVEKFEERSPVGTPERVAASAAESTNVAAKNERSAFASTSRSPEPKGQATGPVTEKALKTPQVRPRPMTTSETRSPGQGPSHARPMQPAPGHHAHKGGDEHVERLRPKTQFEIELERARQATAAKQAALAAQKAAEAERPSMPGRPAVGTIIELPLPRIQITERGPGGRPLQPQGRIPVPGTPPATTDRGKWAEQQRGGGRKQDLGAKKKLPPGKKARSTMITTPAEHKRVIKMDESVSVSELARQMGIKATEVLKKLWSMGMVGVNINQSIDYETSSLLASEFGYEVQSTAFQETAVFAEAEDKPEDLVFRAPVVTVMGHVDHGKTSILDAIRHTDVAAGEAGGITQHIGAYRVSTSGIGDVVFLDTPGHAAFTAMRARGAQVTDIVILVVAADDGIMPQTVEALNHAKDAEVPIVVAVNKCDKPQANPDRVRTQLAEHGLVPEEWGGDTMFVNVSAYTKQGVDKLLEAVQLQAELLELKANPKKLAKGAIVEAKLDRNRGPMATVLVQEGTLRVGDIVVTGEHMGKVRAMLNDKGSNVTEAGPSTPVELLGLDGVPEAGDLLHAVDDEKSAKSVIEHRREQRRKKELAQTGRVSLENILEKIQEGQVKELKIVLKTDVQGSAEALKEALSKLSTEQVKVNVIQAGVGGITESDVNLAKAGGAIIIGFHVRPAGKTSQLAEQEGVDIKLYDIIYEAIDEVKKAMVGLLAPIKKERALGKVEIRDVFNIPKIGTVAGCAVIEGKITRQALVRLVRDSVQVYSGRLGSLRRFKDDVREVSQGYECGLTIEGYNDIKIGDVVEAYEIVEEAPTL